MQARHDERMSTLKMLVDAAPNEAERKKIIKKEIQKILRQMKASHARTTKKLAKMRKKWDEKFGKPSKKKRI
jgi:hypothetical protein